MIGWPERGSSSVRNASVLALQCLVIVACVGLTTWAAASAQESQMRALTEERVLDVARSLADLEQVHDVLDAPGVDREAGTEELQPIADLVGDSSGVDYIVITDAEGIRLTHPNPENRGEVVSTDPSSVLAGDTFVGTETGTIGPTLRAKVPVFVDDEVVGSASVGILESEIAEDQRAQLLGVLPWTLGALVVGCLAAALLARVVHRRVRRLESQVAELATERRIARALREATHEFRTRLHVVYGLVESGDDAGALDYIADFVPVADAHGSGAELADPRLRALIGSAAQELANRDGSLRVDPLSSVDLGRVDDDDITVIANLVQNAVDAADHVRLRVQADESGLDVVVEDDGPGVSAEALPRLFEHGYTSKESHPTGVRGVGLSLVMRIVERRRGHVDVDASGLGGARFAVSLPVAADSERVTT